MVWGYIGVVAVVLVVALITTFALTAHRGETKSPTERPVQVIASPTPANVDGPKKLFAANRRNGPCLLISSDKAVW
jgi:hypothetical protein